LQREWTGAGVLAQDSARSLYVLHQEYELDGVRINRRGFFARLRLEPFGGGMVFPHEQTMAGPKADRLSLLRATGVNLSPIFGLFPDPANEVQNLLDRATERQLPIEASDHLGVVSRLWPISDQSVISQVAGLIGPKPIFIADGHHRYETALRFLEEQRAAGQVANDLSAANYVLTALVGMSDPGLLILPTHRLLQKIPAFTANEVRSLLAPQFDVEIVGEGESGMRETWARLELSGDQHRLGFGTFRDGVWQIASLRDHSVMAKLASDHSPAWQSLAVSILHVVVIDHLLRERGFQPECRYVHLLQEVKDSEDHELAVLVPTATMGHVERIAGNHEKMPPKSTYFYPKLLSGLVMHSVRGS
jgi:uncharacterized protein (DUF1015 family)